MTNSRRHLSYANVVSSLALVFAMSGGALAANHYLIHSTKQISPKVRKALAGKTGKTGPAGPQGPPGATGPSGTAKAFAHITSAGTLDAANSLNVPAGGISSPSGGVYCIGGLSFTPKNVVATVDFQNGGGNGPVITATLGVGGGSGCPAGTQITVGTGTGGTPALAARAFYININ